MPCEIIYHKANEPEYGDTTYSSFMPVHFSITIDSIPKSARYVNLETRLKCLNNIDKGNLQII